MKKIIEIDPPPQQFVVRFLRDDDAEDNYLPFDDP
jgi:hypothetical protein